jgi:hypothetical protein
MFNKFSYKPIMVKSHYIVQSSVGSTLSHTRSFSSTSVRRMDPINTAIVGTTAFFDPIVFSLFIMTCILGSVFLATYSYTLASSTEISPPVSFNYLLLLFDLHYEFTRSVGDVLHHVHINIGNLNEEQLRMLSFYLPLTIHVEANVSVLLDF